MKKILTTILLMVICASLVACKKTTTKPTTSGKPLATTTTAKPTTTTKEVITTTTVKPTTTTKVVVASEVTFDLVSSFSTYAAEWSSSYGPQVIDGETLNDAGLKATIDFTRVNKQQTGNSIDDRPVIATNSKYDAENAYITITEGEDGAFAGFTSITFDLLQWTTKYFDDIHIEYSTDLETWNTCSESITNPQELVSSSVSGAKAFRLVFSCSQDKNIQCGISGFTLK